MPPIPVHIDAPITPQQANEPTTTTPAAYPAARPAQAVGPVPTPYNPQPATAPIATPTRTTALQENGPPAPQPGAVPIPYNQYAPHTPVSALPPPPRAGQAPITTMPAQMQTSPPQQNYAPTHSTSTTTTPQQPMMMQPTTLNLGPVSSPAASGPPGYQQNVYAQELSSAQRASLDQQERRESLAGGGLASTLGLAGGGLGNSSGEKSLGGTGGAGFGESGVTAGEMWSSVKGWASAAGDKLAETEKAVWERVNKR